MLGVAWALTVWLSSAEAVTSADRLAEAVAAYRAFRHEHAAELLEPIARDGNAGAQRMLAYMYSNGQGVERDPRLAARLYCMSIHRGPDDEVACPWFVYLVREEPDMVFAPLVRSDRESFETYRARAEAGDPDAQVAVGLLLASGTGTNRDLVRAYVWLARAAEQRHATAGRFLEALELEMTREQIAEGRKRARESVRGERARD